MRSEKIRAQNIVDELQKEKDEKEGKGKMVTPSGDTVATATPSGGATPTLPTITPSPSAGSVKTG